MLKKYMSIYFCLIIIVIGVVLLFLIDARKSFKADNRPTEPPINLALGYSTLTPTPTERCWSEITNPCWQGYDYGFMHARTGEFNNWLCPHCENTISPRYGFTTDDIYLLTQLLVGDVSVDGDGEYDFVWAAENKKDIRYDQISLVLCVVMNRVRSDEFPNTVREVVLQPGHFKVMPRNANTVVSLAAYSIVEEWCQAYDEWSSYVQTIPRSHLYFRSGPNNEYNISREKFKEE